jgi:hypothetical protein
MSTPSKDRELFGTLLASTPAKARSWRSLGIAVSLHAALITLAIVTFKPFVTSNETEEEHPLSIMIVEEDAVQPLPNPFARASAPAAAPLRPIRKEDEQIVYRPGPLEPIVIEEGPPAPSTTVEPEGVAGGQAGGVSGGSLSGRLMPAGADPRIIGATPRAFPPAEKTGAEALRERLSNSLSAWNDSVAAEAEAARRATDWTVRDKNGGRWGVAPDGIYLGKIKLPQVALAPHAGRRDEINARNRDFNEIEKQAYLEESRSSFKERVQSIRERKERERAEKRKKVEEKPITESR